MLLYKRLLPSPSPYVDARECPTGPPTEPQTASPPVTARRSEAEAPATLTCASDPDPAVEGGGTQGKQGLHAAYICQKCTYVAACTIVTANGLLHYHYVTHLHFCTIYFVDNINIKIKLVILKDGGQKVVIQNLPEAYVAALMLK